MYPDRETRADAIGVWAAVSGLALALGPVIGGVLVGFSSWRAIFWFNLGFGVVAFVLAAVAVPETSDRQGRRVDVVGILLAATFLSCMSIAVIQGEDSGYTASGILGLFVVSGVAGVGFVIWEQRVTSPMLDLKLFRRAPFAGSNFVAFAAYFGTFSIFFFTALYLQVVANQSAYQTALDFIPMAVGMIIASVVDRALGGTHRSTLAHDDRLPVGRRGDPGRQRRARAHGGLRPAGLGPAHCRHRHRHAARAR